jgi:hypothetical protein
MVEGASRARSPQDTIVLFLRACGQRSACTHQHRRQSPANRPRESSLEPLEPAPAKIQLFFGGFHANGGASRARRASTPTPVPRRRQAAKDRPPGQLGFRPLARLLGGREASEARNRTAYRPPPRRGRRGPPPPPGRRRSRRRPGPGARFFPCARGYASSDYSRD